MGKYIIKRLMLSVVVLFGVTLVIFLLLHLTGDPIDFIAPPDASEETLQAYRVQYGLDKSLPVQFAIFVRDALHGNFGTSYHYNQPAMQLVLERMPATITLALVSLAVAVIWSIPAGSISAVKRNSAIDSFVRVFSMFGQSVPSFWMGVLFILIFGVKLKWFPTFGSGTPAHLVLPVLTLATHSAASITRLMRSGMLDVLGKEFITACRAKGLSERVVISKHAFKNSLSSVVTIVGLQLATLMGGSVVVENVFAYPGVGRLIVQSILTRDFMVVQAGVLLIAVGFIGINFIVDLLYAVINPRIRYE